MKIVQQAQPKFEPIAIILETREEAEDFWEAIRSVSCRTVDQNILLIKISNYFSNEAKL